MTRSWVRVVLPLLGPGPEGRPATIEVPCSADPGVLGTTTHPVTIHPDWSVETPHDLDAERVASAFGGYCSCLELVEKVVPAARDRVQLLSRRTTAHLARQPGDRWVPTSMVDGCCAGSASSGRSTPEKAAEHVRSNRHQAALAGCRADLLRHVTAALVGGHCAGGRAFTASGHELREADARVTGAFGGRRLWDVGLHPRLVPLIHQAASPRAVPLPLSFYLGVVTQRPDLAWVRRTLDAALADDSRDTAAEQTAEWLAWTFTREDAGRPTMRGEFLELGVPWPMIQQLTEQRLRPEQVRSVADLVGFSPAFAADLLVAWSGTGVRLDDAAEFKWLVAAYRSGAPAVWRPSRPALQALKSETRGSARGMTPAHLCAVLGAAGTVHFAAAAIAEGVTDPAAVHRWLHADARQVTADTP